jgi:excisionase family DNA binding protein
MHDLHNSPTKAALAYGIADAARALGIGRSSLYRLIAGGQLEARALGGRTVVPAASLHAFLAALPPAPIRPAKQKPAIAAASLTAQRNRPDAGHRGGGTLER